MFTKISTLLIDWAFKNSKIELCDFSRLDMKKSIFSECTIREADFIDVDLSNSDFSNSDLQATKFQNSNLEEVDFTEARNYYIDPTQNKLKKAKFSSPEVLSLLAGFEIEVDDIKL